MQERRKKEEHKIWDDCWNYPKAFADFESFEKYLNDPENQADNAKIGKDDFVNFDSIIPNEEIMTIGLWNNSYEVNYYADVQSLFTRIYFTIRYDNDPIENSSKDHDIIDNAIEDTDMSQKGTYIFDINGTLVGYSIYGDGKCSEISFDIDRYSFTVRGNDIFKTENHTEAQKAFIEAFFTEQGTADMLERIKALLPQE